MCGRAYETYTDEELYFQYPNRRPLKLLQFTPTYNLCPTQDSPVLRLVEGERQFDAMRWQLVPNWEPTFSTKVTTINAKNGFRQSPFSGIRIWPAVHRSIERYAAFGIRSIG